MEETQPIPTPLLDDIDTLSEFEGADAVEIISREMIPQRWQQPPLS